MSLATMRSSTLQLSSAQNILEDDEAVLDSALDNGLFHCLPHCLVTKKTLTGEEFYLRRIHQLITDLIVLMPLKVRPTFLSLTVQFNLRLHNQRQDYSQCQ